MSETAKHKPNNQDKPGKAREALKQAREQQEKEDFDDFPISKGKSSANSESSKQYDLFASLFGPSGDTEQLSNLLTFWDSIPRYSVSRQIQASMRNETGNLPILYKEFTSPTGEVCEMELRPARIIVEDEEKDFYPSETEELIEDIFRKIFLTQNYGIHDPQKGESWCKFTVNMIVKELKKHGKVRSHDEVKQAIEIMENTRLQITVNGKQAYSSNILSDKVLASKEDYKVNGNSLSAVKFSSIISRAIDKYDYRQFNYGLMIELNNQLSRWLFKRLSARYLNAGLDAPAYKLIFSDVDKDSGLLHHTLVNRRIDYLRQSIKELVETNTLTHFEEKKHREGRRVIDATFYLYPSTRFIRDMKAANARQKQIRSIENKNAPSKK